MFVCICVQFQSCVPYTVAIVDKRVTQKELSLHEQTYIRCHIVITLYYDLSVIHVAVA